MSGKQNILTVVGALFLITIIGSIKEIQFLGISDISKILAKYLFGINDNYPIFIAKIDEEKRQYLVVYLGKYDIHWI